MSAHLQVYILDRHDGLPARVGIVVSRKHGGAVERNRIRRRIKEVVRIMRLTNPGIDLVVVARRGIDEASYDQISTEFNQIMEGRSAHCGPEVG